MKAIQFFSMLTFMFVMQAAKMAHAEPTKSPAYFQQMYIPGGYDSNDHIQIVGEGKFSNSCFRQAETKLRIDEVHKTIFISPVAYVYPGICLMVIVPYQKTVDVGILKPGQWNIYQETNQMNVGKIQVRAASTKSADDYLYAPVSQGFFYQTGATGHVVITGVFTNSCMRLDQVKTTIEPNVIAVQPIASMDPSALCRGGSFPFSKDTEINNVPAGRYLLHIRSLNGNAINSLIDIQAPM